MNLAFKKSILKSAQSIAITGSKSESNRLLLLQALYPEIVLENASHSDDTKVMSEALSQQIGAQKSQIIDVHHAGTAMRFLTAYFAFQEGKDIILTGSSRMKDRPIGLLVDALRQIGAEIKYVEREGFPPLKITGKKLAENKVTLAANISSQFISALLLIAPKLERGLELTLKGEITSIPYINMTLQVLKKLGVETSFENNVIKVHHLIKIQHSKFTIESDWSSASYWYSIIALSAVGAQVTLSNFQKNSLQGDAEVVEIFENFGVVTIFNNNQITLHKVANSQCSVLNLQLNKVPDIAQTIAVTCFGLGLGCNLTGLHTLKIKETDRLEALKIELSKLGADISVTDDSLHLKPTSKINQNRTIITYEDHRMAMAFAPLALKVPITIENAHVVSKSYPTFWNDLKQVGFQISD